MSKNINYNTVNKYFNIQSVIPFLNSDDLSLNHMMWKLRKTDDCLRYPYLIIFLRKLFIN